jgi:hypothetical protein
MELVARSVLWRPEEPRPRGWGSFRFCNLLCGSKGWCCSFAFSLSDCLYKSRSKQPFPSQPPGGEACYSLCYGHGSRELELARGTHPPELYRKRKWANHPPSARAQLDFDTPRDAPFTGATGWQRYWTVKPSAGPCRKASGAIARSSPPAPPFSNHSGCWLSRSHDGDGRSPGRSSHA